MDSNEDSGSTRFVLTRKPYTITKQRERWSEEEHNRFLEALKLYGRAWQKIEEHIGTKTAVQIRSHAQKFFTKLEKEAVNKGIPIGQTHDIEIPPPRPKRKPSNPYPRKISVGSLSQGGAKEGKQSTDSSLRQETHLLDLEKEPLLELSEDNGTLENTEVSNLLEAAQRPSSSLPNENTLNFAKSGNSCTFVEFVPSLRESIDEDESCKSLLTTGDCKEGKRLDSNRRQSSHDKVNNSKMMEFLSLKPPQDKMVDNCDCSENLGSFPSNEVQATQKYPRHVPVHILDGSLGTSVTNIISEISHQESIPHQTSGHCENISISGNPSTFTPEHQSHTLKPSVQQSFCNFLPIFPPIPDQYHYRASAHASSTFASLIISALLQNPAAHAAATFAATNGLSEAPSMAAIAGATVAAATAWWAVNGLLPSPTAFNCSPTSSFFAPMDTTEARAVKSDERETIRDADLQDQQQLVPECSGALQEQHPVSKSPSESTSNSEEHEDANQNAGISAHEVEEIDNNLKSRKQVDRSSCGSNTSSSSDVETDALLKHDKGNEEPQQYDINQQSNDRRGRIFSNINDPWKEVSEEGRVAFQALFTRDVLPQSFYYCQNLKNKGNKIGEHMQPERNDDVQLQSNDHHMVYSGSNSRLVDYLPPLIDEKNKKEGLPTLGIELANLKTRRTGFKPYKRCSIEEKDSRDDEKSPKRIRVEGGEAAST